MLSPLTDPWRALWARVGLMTAVAVVCGLLVGTLFLPSALAMSDVINGVMTTVLDIPPLPDSFEIPPQRSQILAADGSEIATIFYEENRVTVPLEDVPVSARNAVIATEDSNFWNHAGIDHRAIIRAAIANLSAGDISQGGSTITQQYIKNAADLTRDKDINRKIHEAVWAAQLEKRLPKTEILERYLNESYFGNGIYGIGTAAEFYFSKPISSVTLAEAALLAGLIRDPGGNDPIDNPEAAVARRNIVLDQMVSQELVSTDQAEAARREDLELNLNPVQTPNYPFFVDWVTRLLINESTARGLGTQVDALSALGETPDDRIRAVFQSGLRIHTTINLEYQQAAQAAIGEFLSDPLRDPMGAIVSVEPGTGRILAMAVGPKAWGVCDEPAEVTEDGTELCDKTKFNPAVPADKSEDGTIRAGRQPGSAFKPYTIAAALEAGIPPTWQINATGPQTIPFAKCNNAGTSWTVNNSGGDGLRDMYSGVAGSSNVFHARLIAEIGPARVKDMATRLGIRSSNLEAVCSMTLGSEEVFPLEMATAYATFANRGEYCAPYAIDRIEDRDGNLLYQQAEDCEQVLSRDIADTVVDIMRGPVSAGGTAPHANLGTWPTRGKTGTTQDYIDAWFVGYVRQISTAAWVGYENGPNTGRLLMRNVTINGEFRSRVFGSTIPAPMWKAYMAIAVANLDPKGFPGPGRGARATTVPDLTGVADLEEAARLVELARLNLEIITVDDWKAEGTILGQSPAAGEEVPEGRAILLEISSGLGERPPVPDVIGLSRKNAIEKLAQSGYGAVVVTKKVNDPAKVGKVIDQSPVAGAEVPDLTDPSVVIQVGIRSPGGGSTGGSTDGSGTSTSSPTEPPTGSATGDPLG